MSYFIIIDDYEYPSGFLVLYPDINIKLETDILKHHKIFFDACTKREQRNVTLRVDRIARVCHCKIVDIIDLFIKYDYNEFIEPKTI